MIFVRITCLILLEILLWYLISDFKDEEYEKHIEGRIRNIRKIDMWETDEMLRELHEMIEENQDIRWRLNYYIEKNARQMRYWDIKKEPSDDSTQPDNSI